MNLDKLNQKLQQVEGKRNPPRLIVVKQSPDNPNEYRTLDGELFTGDLNAANILTVEYTNDWRGTREPETI